MLGVLLAGLFAGSGPSGAGIGTAAGAGWPALRAAAVVAVAAVLVMVVPALTTVTPGTARARRGRQAAVSGVTRAGGDLALVVLAVIAGWQLRHYSAVSAGANGNFGVDPVVVIAPALALAGGTVLALRLLPAGGKAGDRLAARGRRLTAALASWQISRQPIRQGGAALLIVLAVATGTLALAQRQSWTRSDHDQAAFGAGRGRAGADQPAAVGGPGQRPGAGARGTAGHAGRDLHQSGRRRGDPGDRLGPGGRGDAAPRDQSPLPEAALFGEITPGRTGKRDRAARPPGPNSRSPRGWAPARSAWPRPR